MSRTGTSAEAESRLAAGSWAEADGETANGRGFLLG